MNKPTLVTAPTELPLTVAECRDFAQIDWVDDDSSIEIILRGVVDEIDGFGGYLGRAIMAQTWRKPFEAWPVDGVFELCAPDVSAVAIHYQDADGAEQTINSANYVLREGWRGSFVQMLSSFVPPALGIQPGPLWVDFTAGAATPEDVPADIKAVLVRLVAHRERHRGVMGSTNTTAAIPMGIDGMLDRLRWPRARV